MIVVGTVERAESGRWESTRWSSSYIGIASPQYYAVRRGEWSTQIFSWYESDDSEHVSMSATTYSSLYGERTAAISSYIDIFNFV